MKDRKDDANLPGEKIDAILRKWMTFRLVKKTERRLKIEEAKWKKQAREYKGNDPKVKEMIRDLEGRYCENRLA